MSDVKAIVKLVCAEFNGKPKDILSPRRGKPEAARLRRIAMWLAMETDNAATFTKIGAMFDRDRTTVRHAYLMVNGEMVADQSLASRLRRLQQQITA